jgi:hypothetical protein
VIRITNQNHPKEWRWAYPCLESLGHDIPTVLSILTLTFAASPVWLPQVGMVRMVRAT